MKRGWFPALFLGIMATCSSPPQQADLVGPDIREFQTVLFALAKGFFYAGVECSPFTA